MTVVFDWHSQDCRASGPLDVAHTVTQQYGPEGETRQWWYMNA